MRIIPLMVGAAIAAFPLAATAQAVDEHHDAPPAATRQTEPGPAMQPGMMGAPGMGMMGAPGMGMMGAPGAERNQMMNQPGMMQMMMQMMGMMQGRGMMDMSGGDMTSHVEGRIAYVRAELKISDTQTRQWEQFAEAIRANARRLSEIAPAMVPKEGQKAATAPTLVERLDQQERLLRARLDGVAQIKTAFERLATVLSPEQKKSAEELIPPHVGLAPMGMMPMGRM